MQGTPEGKVIVVRVFAFSSSAQLLETDDGVSLEKGSFHLGQGSMAASL